MVIAESVFDGIGYLGERIVVILSGSQKDEQSIPEEIPAEEPPEWNFYPKDPFDLGSPIFFHAMRRLIRQLFTHA